MPVLFNLWKSGLQKTSKAAFGRISNILGATEITPDVWDELEALLLQSDVGVKAAGRILDQLKQVVGESGLTKKADLDVALTAILKSMLVLAPPDEAANSKPKVILVVGVNGSGKTTTIGKLGSRYKAQGSTVVFGAADTFRAAASEQLMAWGARSGIEVIRGEPDSDAGAVAYNTVQYGAQKAADIVLVDTAGRLHTRFNLMEELKKVHRVLGKAMPGAPHQVLLVLDATTGQNAIQQAKVFKEAVSVNGVILTKLDSSAKGGVAFSIAEDLKLPILFAGLGEKAEDLVPFEPESFIESLLNQG